MELDCLSILHPIPLQTKDLYKIVLLGDKAPWKNNMGGSTETVEITNLAGFNPIVSPFLATYSYNEFEQHTWCSCHLLKYLFIYKFIDNFSPQAISG